MEEKRKVVVLHGFWASPFTRWVKISLEIKGIPYEYVEENMKKKDQLLLQYNPIYKKVPVLVHNGKPIVESLLILQYIDETWKGSPQFLPLDSYSRSTVWFWAYFISNQLLIPLIKIMASPRTEEQKLVKDVKMNLSILEENMKVIFPCDSFPSCGKDMKMLDILLSILPNFIKGIELAFDLKILEPERCPLACSRMASLCDLAVVEKTAPSLEKMVIFCRNYRRKSTSKL